MAEEIELERCNFRNCTDAVTLTLNRVILHTVMHHSLTSMYTPNFIEIGQTFCGRMYGRMDVPTNRQTFPPLMLTVSIFVKFKCKTVQLNYN